MASGAGRYLFELQKEAEGELDLHLNDIDENSLAAAQVIKDEFTVSNITFSQHDVFDLKLMKH